MKEAMEITEVVDRISAHQPNTKLRDASAVPVGKCFRQGDVYFARVDAVRHANLTERKNRQLVAGTSRGSRHVIDGSATLYEPERSLMPAYVDDDALLLPSVVVGKGGATLTHPEHAWFTLPAGSNWVTWQQMDPRTRQRVQD